MQPIIASYEVGSANIRQQISGKAFTSIPAATIAVYDDLSYFERGVVVRV